MATRNHNIKTALSNQTKYAFQSLPLLSKKTSNLRTPSKAVLMHSPLTEDKLNTDQWAFSIRQRIQTFVNQEENIPTSVLSLLKNELIQVFIRTLQEDSCQHWTFLHDVLQLLVPFRDYLEFSESDQELQHYLRRIWSHLSSLRMKELDVDILEILSQIFPKIVNDIEEEAGSTKSFPKFGFSQKKKKEKLNPRQLVPQNDTDIFSTKLTKSKLSQPLTVLDLHRSIGTVAYDIAAYESFWGSCCGLTAQAVNVNLPEEILEAIPKAEEKEKVIEEKEVKNVSAKKSKSPEKVESKLVLSGSEAVAYYTKCQYLRRVEHLYFNIAPSRHYRPYDLMSVPKDKVNAEHYLFSSFGILHVDEDSNSETYKLREWQRNAILWEAIRQIPFFKNFLVSKTFYRWKISKSLLKILKIKETLERTLIQSMPIYEAGLLQVSKLLNELVTIDFLPFQKGKCYTLTNFEETVMKVQMNAKEYLERFFRLCKVIVDVIMFESFKKLRFCEEQMMAKNMFSKDSLYQMKLKKKQRTINFLKAKNETSHLGNFVMLINLMTVEHLFTISKSHICKFTDEVLRSKMKDKGFFCIKLIFNEEDQLEFSPPIEKCEESLEHNLHGIASLLCSKAVPLGILEMSKTKSTAIKPDISDNSEALKKYMRQFLLANPKLLTDSPDILKNLPFASRSQEMLEDDLYEAIDLEKLKKTMPTKSEDVLGVATPDYMQRQPNKQVSGEGFLGQYTPLYTSKVEERLFADPQYLNCLEHQTNLLSNAKEDLKKYIDSLDWLLPIYKTCKQWKIGSCTKLQHLPPQSIEQKLGELKSWGQRVKTMDTSFRTDNTLFWLDCSIIRDRLVPQLDSIYQALVEYFLQESKKTSIWFCKEIDDMAKTLDGKPDEVTTFAEYVKFFNKGKENIPEYKEVVDNKKAIFEIIRTYHRPLTDVEFQHENNLWRQWEVLQVMMQNASEFVSTQAPIMERQMEEIFKKLEMQASEYCEEANSGVFLDPSQNRSEMVDRIRQIRIKFYDSQQKLTNFSKWRKDVSGESFDLSFLNELTAKMDARNDLWKYLLQTIQSIDAWKLMPFKKIKFGNAVKKINEWKAIAAQLKSVLPPGDLVVEFWEQCLDTFLEPLPLLQIMCSERHKIRHLKAIFHGMSAVYIRTKEYLVQELLSLNLTHHRDMIMSVHQMAIAEYDLELRLKKMKKNWAGKMFKLLKYFPDGLKFSKGKSFSELKKRNKNSVSRIVCPDDVYYILIDMELLKTELMDDSIILATMLSSSYLGDMKAQVQNLAFALYQVEEIIALWVSAQKKWMFLVKIFERPAMIERFPEFAAKFETSVHIKFREWMRVVYADSKVLSVASKSITEKGYRFLQGEQLRNMFLNIIESMDNILDQLSFLLEESRMIFPRLFFLSDNELIEVLSISDDPHELPGVRKCFPGIDSITLTVLGTNQMSSKVAASELAINAHRSISIGFEGKHGEQVKLLKSVGPMMGVIQWLCDFESSMKDTMVDQLQRCVVEKFKSVGLIRPFNAADDFAMTFSQWIKEFPLECLRLAEAITWEQQMRKFLQNADRPAIKKLRSDIQKQIYNLSHLPQWHYLSTPVNLDDRRYYIRTLLIVHGINLRDLTQVILESETINLRSFEWQTALKYHVTYKQLLRPRREKEEIPCLDPITNGIDARLIRTKTTMSSSYDISNCEIHHLSVGIPYGYEYLGLTSVFLNTPTTEKAMLSLTQSLKNYQCGAIVGPSSVGKTETVKEFSRAFGQCMYHIKCGELVSSFQIKQYMSGLVTSGCWALFDNVSRLTKDVMCSLSHYLDQVQTAIRGLQSEKNSQYELRGQTKADKKHLISPFGPLTRRNSLTTLHSLEKEPTSEDIMAPLNRQRAHGSNEKGSESFYGENWVYQNNQKRRRSSICDVLFEDLEFNSPSLLASDEIKEEWSCFDFNNRPQVQPSKLFHQKFIGNIKFNGRYLQASSSYGCFMTLSANEAGYQDIPDNFRLLLRPFSLLTPDYQQIAQVYCLICGFEQHENMAKKLLMFINLFQTWLPLELKFKVQNLSFLMFLLNTVKKHIAELAEHMYEEKQFIIGAIKEVFIPYLDEGRDKKQFWNLLQEVFGFVPLDNTKGDLFRKALQNQLIESHLEINPAMISKMVELYKSCSLSLRSTIICGPPGSGKTFILKTLIQSLNMLSYKAAAIEKPVQEIIPEQEADVIISKANQKINKRMKLLRTIISSVRPPPSTLNKAILKKKLDSNHFPRIYMSHLFPSSMPAQEFLGYYDSNGWKSGALWRELHKSSFSDAIIPQCDGSKPNPIADTQVWLVFDGTLHSSWCDPIASLFDSSRKLILPNADSFILKDETKLIIETGQLNDASPTMLNQCSVVFCSPSNFKWESLFNAWIVKLASKCYMNNVGLSILDELADAMIPATLKFLHPGKGINAALLEDLSPLDYQPAVVGLQEVTSFLNLLSILLEKALFKEHNPENNTSASSCIPSEVCVSLFYRPDEHIPHYKNIIQAYFVFSFIWAFGAHLHERNKDAFSDHVRQCLSKRTKPIPFPSDGSVFDYWVDESNGKFCAWTQKLSLTPSTNIQSSYVFISEFERYDYLTKLLLDNNIPVLISGDPGVGKTTFIQNIVLKEKTRRHLMSPLQTPDRFLEIILLREYWSSAGTGKGGGLSASAIQRGKVMNSLKKKKAGEAHIIFIDDLNMAPKENGCQPTLELFRQVLTLGTVFDKQHQTDCNVKHLDFLAATTIPTAPGAGIDRLCHVMNSRFTRLFFNITFHTPTYDQLNTIYSCSIFTWLDEFPSSLKDDPSEMAKAITLGTLDLYFQIKAKLHASPCQPLYIFSLHEIARVFEGIKLFTTRAAHQRLAENRRRTLDISNYSPSNISSGRTPHHFDGNLSNKSLPVRGTVIRLWAHECNRTFADRIINKNDYDWYLQCLHHLTTKYFCKTNPFPNMGAITEVNSEFETASIQISSSQVISPVHTSIEDDFDENSITQDSEESIVFDEHSHLTQAKSEKDPETEAGPTTNAALVEDGPREDSPAQDKSNSDIERSNEVFSPSSDEVEPKTNATSAEEDRPESENTSYQTQRDTMSESERTSESDRQPDTDRQSSETSAKRPNKIKNGDSQSEGIRSSLSKTPLTDTKKTPSFPSLVPLSIQKMAQTDFHGGLMHMEDIKGDLGSLDEVIFSRYILFSENAGYVCERGYTECTMTQLMFNLRKCINRYNDTNKLKWNLTLLDEFLPLIIRLTRILTLTQGHGLLVRSSYQSTGRKALSRLAAYLAKAEVFEPIAANREGQSYDDLLEKSFKLACHHAGALASPTVLIIPEIFAYNADLTSIATLLAQGVCPSLYGEATKLSHLVQTALSEKKNSVNKLTDEQMVKVFQIFFNRLKQNLHILICLTLEDSGMAGGIKLTEFLERYPSLIKHCCSVQVQHPMSTPAYQKLVLSWVIEEEIQFFPMDIGTPAVIESVFLDTISSAMAYIHRTAHDLVRRVYHNRKIFINYTINHLRELVHVYKQMVMYIIETEKENISHYAGALGKVNEAYGSINNYRETICRLSPIHKTAVNSIQDHVADLAEKRATLKQLLSLSKEQEAKIQKLEALRIKMIATIDRMLHELEPQYQEILSNLTSIDKDAWSELKNYRQPPEPIKKLFGAVCILFGKHVTWEEGQVLMSEAYFLNYITYFNIKELSDEMYTTLNKYITDLDFKPQRMSMYSKAASSVSKWVCSVHRYSTLLRKIKPMQAKQADVENKLVKAKSTLGKLRKETKFCKTALAQNVKICKESMKNAKALEKQIENFEKKVADASNLMGNISSQHRIWKKEVIRANLNLSTVLGDGLLVAAYLCYCGPLDGQTRKNLLADWMEHFDLRTFTDITAAKLYPKVYSESLQVKCVYHSCDDHDSHPTVSVKAYEANVHESEFNYIPGLIVDSNDESLDDIIDYDSDEDEAKKVLKIRKNFQILKVLSSYEEMSEWRMKNYPVDSRSLENACLIKMCKLNFSSLWPLLVDPDDQAEQWVRNLHLSTEYRDSKGYPADSTMQSARVSLSEVASCASSTFDLLDPMHPITPSLSQGLKYENSEWTTEERICVLQADDPLLDSKIRNAVNNGQLLLVTHVGHQPLHPTLLWLLSCEKIEMDEYEYVLKSDKMTSPCHEDFFLFLSTNVPLNITGLDLHYFPLEQLNIIDLSLSNEAVMNRILYETLQVENLDFEKQRQANETDIIQHRQQLFHEIALLREKTMNLEGPLIEDKTILESLLACQRNVERNRLIIDESCSKERHLEEIYAPFVPMVIEAATIYATLKNIIHLHPCYFASFDTFIKRFVNGLQRLNRKCGEGEPKSRANELMNAATISIFELVSTMMFEEHLTIFYLEFTLQRYLQNKMATELEIGIFFNGFKINRKRIGSLLAGNPNWISKQAWAECFLLESMVEAFKGLRASMMIPFMSKQWKEYFKNSIILMNQVPEPTLKNLTILQKSLLWKIICPDRFSELCHSLIVSELGNMIIPPDNYNIKNVYKMMQTNTPVLFILPSSLKEGQVPDGTQGFLFSDPVREVKRFAKEMGMDGRLCIANCTSELTKDSLKEIVTECFNNGYWLILQNYHMCSPEIHLSLASIMKVTGKEKEKEKHNSSSTSEIFSGDNSPNYTSSNASPSTAPDVQPEDNFRLWVTFASEQSNRGLPPACLIQPSIKVTCETSRNFQSTLLKCHRASKFLFHRHQFDHVQYHTLIETKNYEIMAIAVLHSLLIQHRCFTYLRAEKRAVFNQPCYWSLLDMASVSDIFCHWLPIRSMELLEKVADLVGGIYASHCTDEYDAARVKAFALDTLKTMFIEKMKSRRNAGSFKTPSPTPPDTASSCHTLKGPDYLCSESQLTPDLLSVLFSFNDTAKRRSMDADARNQISIKGLAYSLHQKSDGTKHGSFFSDVHYKVYGLPAMAQSTLLQYQSWILSKEIHNMVAQRCMCEQMDIDVADIFQTKLDKILEEVTEELNSLPYIPDISKMVTLYSDENFVLFEIQNYTQLFQLITIEMHVLKKHLVAKTGLTNKMLHVKKQISKNEIPTPWLSYGFPSNLKLTDWLKRTLANMKYALSLVNHFSAFQPHDLGRFLRPDCLLSAIIETYAAKHQKRLIHLSIEGVVQDESDECPPGAIILTNAILCNAKWQFGSLEFVESNTTTKFKDDEDCSCPKSVIYLKIVEKSEEESNQIFYHCPVFQSQTVLDLSKRNSITEIPLPVTRDSLYFSGKKVHLHFSHEEED